MFVVSVLVAMVFSLLISGVSRVSYSFPNAPIEMHGGPLKLYIVDLDGVGGVKAANHSAVVEGAIQSIYINYMHKLSFGVYITDWAFPDYDVEVFITPSYELVTEWQRYRQVVEEANDTIIVNTHDEILPVPNDYTREEWVAKIADFILNRWGTWVHTGGLAFHTVRYQNGTVQEWNDGFKALMKHANQNITIKNPPKYTGSSDTSVSMEMYGRTMLYLSDFGVTLELGCSPLTYFWHAAVDWADGSDQCMRFGQDDVDTSIMPIYNLNSTVDLALYVASASLRLSNTTGRYGVFVYSSPWMFLAFDSSYIGDYRNSLGMGIIPSSVAIWCEAGLAARKIVEASAAEWKSETAVQEATDAFNIGHYKLAVTLAENAMSQPQSNIIPAVALTTVVAVTMTAAVTIGYSVHTRKRKKEEKKNATSKNTLHVNMCNDCIADTRTSDSKRQG